MLVNTKQIRPGKNGQVLTTQNGTPTWTNNTGGGGKEFMADRLAFTTTSGVVSSQKNFVFTATIPNEYVGRTVEITPVTSINIERIASQNATLSPPMTYHMSINGTEVFTGTVNTRPYHNHPMVTPWFAKISRNNTTFEVRYKDRDNIVRNIPTSVNQGLSYLLVKTID